MLGHVVSTFIIYQLTFKYVKINTQLVGVSVCIKNPFLILFAYKDKGYFHINKTIFL